MASIIKDKAQQVCDDMAKNQGIDQKLAFDVMLIIAIIGVIVNLVRLFIECKQSHQQAQAKMANPGLMERWRLRRAIREHVDDGEVQAALASQLFNSSINISSKLKVEEVAAMYDEVQNNPNPVPTINELLAL